MATDDEERRYTLENPHPADEDLSQVVKEFIYENPDELPKLDEDDFGVERPDPLFDGERIHLESDGE